MVGKSSSSPSQSASRLVSWCKSSGVADVEDRSLKDGFGTALEAGFAAGAFREAGFAATAGTDSVFELLRLFVAVLLPDVDVELRVARLDRDVTLAGAAFTIAGSSSSSSSVSPSSMTALDPAMPLALPCLTGREERGNLDQT